MLTSDQFGDFSDRITAYLQVEGVLQTPEALKIKFDVINNGEHPVPIARLSVHDSDKDIRSTEPNPIAKGIAFLDLNSGEFMIMDGLA